MRARSRAMAAASLTTIALLATACGGGGSTPDPAVSQGAQQGGDISIRGGTPQNPLIPANTAETNGSDVLEAVTARLVHYNADTAAPELDIAESIETTDNQTFTVKLKPGYKFHDGTDVLAKNFVDAWNWDAYGPNGYLNSYFFEPISGYADLQCGSNADGESDCDAKPPKSKTMDGLKVVDDTTFTIKTSTKVSNLPVRLGYLAFAPLPDSFFDDPDAYGQKPVGAGPFKFDLKSDTEMVVSKFADYSGENKPSVDKVTFRIYTDDGAAYNDVQANNLDFTDVIPSDRLAGDLWKTELDGRNGQRDTGTIAVTSFSPIDENLKDVNLRRAISMAIDRELINTQIFNGTRPPLNGWVSPVVDGFKEGACGEYCTYNPAKAKEMYDAAGGYKGGTLTLAVNGDGGHKPWADAACNSIKNTLGVDCQSQVTPDFATLRNQLVKNELKGMFRNGWVMDYPSIENFLAPIYGTGAGSNDVEYSNKAFDDKLKQAAAAATPDEANALYQEAEALLAEDFPSMPMWTYSDTIGWSNRVTDVKMTPFGQLDLTSVKVTG
jgi:oligopeptide transport system substrate-binding protein